jgi:LysM repeat protein
MTQRTSSPARALAVIALACGFLALIVVVGSSLGGGDSQDGNGSRGGEATRQGSTDAGDAPASYVVQNGDTLTSIARETGVSVDRIQALNPGVDPQILISGEKLKLRETP